MVLVRRALGFLVLVSLLAGCGGGGASPPQAHSQTSADPFPADEHAAEGLVAHYVVEYGADSSGATEAYVREAQEPAMVAAPQPAANAVIRYPDGSTQTADPGGAFDAGASMYASHYQMDPQNPFITVEVSVPSQSSLQPFTAQIVAPSAQQESQIWSVWEPAPAQSATASAAGKRHVAASEWIPCGYNISMLMNYVKPGETADVTASFIGLPPISGIKWTYNSCTDWQGFGSNGSVQGSFEGGRFAFTILLVTWYKLRYTAPNYEFKYDHAYDYDAGNVGAYVRVMN